LFLLLNATLFMRPADIFPQVEGLPIYEVLILACIASQSSKLLEQIRYSSLIENPISLCLLVMFFAVVASNVWNGDYWRAQMTGTEFAKVVVYYFLFVATVDSSHRMRTFILLMAICGLILTTLSLLEFHNLIDLPAVAPQWERQAYNDPITHKQAIVCRLEAAGIFSNPNDLARLLVIGITICIYAMAQVGSILRRSLWVLPLAVFTYALKLTYSRGGLLALIGGIVVLFHAKFGGKKSIVFAILFLLPALYLFGGRQTDLETDTGSAQSRIKLWSKGLVAMRSSPVFGIGAGTYKNMAGNHAHNSFVETYVETGFFGGTIFTGAFYVAIAGLYGLKADEMKQRDADLWRLRPYILSIVIGNVVGQLSSARGYSILTYVMLGLAAAYIRLAPAQTSGTAYRVTPALVRRILIVSVISLLTIHFYTKFNARF